MTLTPTFHFVCRYCGTFVDVPGEREQLVDHHFPQNGEWLDEAQRNAFERAGCLDDTCRQCMPIHHKQAAQERDFQAEQDMK